ncbi:stage II sporulation protein M, partial [Fulvivirga sp. RKSG066]|nr:stage II sporulation protein M [Fulvivirga aurantia]
MREAAFVKQNYSRWQEFEELLKNEKVAPPDKLADLFIQVTDDLSFSRTQYPESETTVYLNNLASKIHLNIYKNKKEDKKRFVSFWKYEVPHLFYSAHKQLLYAFIVFSVAILIG